jgi:hypothetical protein
MDERRQAHGSASWLAGDLSGARAKAQSTETAFPATRAGVRNEIDMYVGEQRAEVTGDIQRKLLLLA